MPFDIHAARAALQEAPRHDPARLREWIVALAKPRMSGTEGADAVLASLRERFGGLGYEETAQPFSFSSWPGRYGLTVAGVLLAATGVGGAMALRAGAPEAALAVLFGGLVLTLSPLLLLDSALRLPWGRIQTANHLFTRDDRRPRWLVMAHRDTKSQAVPTLVRSAAIVFGASGWLVLLVLAGLRSGGADLPYPSVVWGGAALAVAAGLVLALSWAANRSPGALDDASGLAALLAVAEDAPPGVGFLITDGEELGLAGARAIVDSLPPVEGVINVEGLDDDGEFRIAEGHGWRRRGSAPQLAAALLTAARALDLPARRRPLPRTILVDHQPLAAAGVPALTMLRGRWTSLLRVHRPADSVRRLDGRGAAEGATLLAGALRLLASNPSHLAGARGAGS